MPSPSNIDTTLPPFLREALIELQQDDVAPSANTIELVREVVFPPQPKPPEQIDVCLVLGSRNCEYRLQRAFSFCQDKSPHYVVSGGGSVATGETEASFMRRLLLSLGVKKDRIHCDPHSRNTNENLRFSLPLIESLASGRRPLNLLLVTAGFHLVRTMEFAREVLVPSPALRLFLLPAYGPHTAPDSWHLHKLGRSVIAAELSKLHKLDLVFPNP